jgi:cell division protein FtsA
MSAAVQDAERGSGVAIEGVVLGIGGAHIRGSQSRAIYEFGRPHEITPEDMTASVKMAADVQLERGQTLLHVAPQEFVLDGRAGFRRPHKGICSRLEANVHIVTASKHEQEGLVAAAHLAHLVVDGVMFEPMAAAYAAFLPHERTQGVALVDIGLNSSDLVVYRGESLLLAASIPIGADRFTRDVAAIFKVAYEDAECLKQEYGCALRGLTADSSFIEVPSPEGRVPREAPRSKLIDVLEARARELFEHVYDQIKRTGLEPSSMETLLLCGGGAQLAGMWDVADLVLNCQSANGLARGIGKWPEELKSPVWTTAAGLAMFSAKLKLHRPPKPRMGGLAGLVLR